MYSVENSPYCVPQLGLLLLDVVAGIGLGVLKSAGLRTQDL